MTRLPAVRRAVAAVSAAVAATFKGSRAVPTHHGRWGAIREAFAGAWQRNVEVDNTEGVLAFSAVYACVTRIANDIAKLRIKLVEQDAQGIWKEVERNSPHASVLRKPNRYQNRIQFLMDWLLMKLLHGNAFILKERDARGVVVALYVLDSRRVQPVITEDGSVYYQISTETLAQQANGGIVRASEIIHDRCPTLWHPLWGVSPIYACASSATMGNRIQANSAHLFENMSRPGGVLVVPGTIDEPNFERLKREWNDNFAGGNIGRTAVLTNGTDYKPFAMPAQDAQLIEQLRWTVEDVARAFAMPLYKIGAGSVPTSGNVAALNKQYYDDCLQVHIEAIELCLDEGLALVDADTDLPMGVELDLDGLLRMDSAAQITMLGEAIKNALMTPDEARLKMNLSPVTGGNVPYLQQQNFSLAALAERDKRPDPFGSATPSPPTPEPAREPASPPADKSATSVIASDDSLQTAHALLAKSIDDVRAAGDRAARAEEQKRSADEARVEAEAKAAQAERDARVAEESASEAAQELIARSMDESREASERADLAEEQRRSAEGARAVAEQATTAALERESAALLEAQAALALAQEVEQKAAEDFQQFADEVLAGLTEHVDA